MLRRKAWWVSVIAVAVVFYVFAGAGFAQCEMCKTALTSSPEGKKLAAGLHDGVLLLLMAPYLLFGTIGFLIFNAYRRRDQERKQTNHLTRLNRWITRLANPGHSSEK